jgi:DNA repair protein RecN (Recombination protein N)
MIRYLHIERLAVIDRLEIEFGPGLSVLTGETGAGKSILVEAVGLLLGGRAAADLVRTGADTASIQAVVEDGDGREIIVRRELSVNGRSRAFVDGALTTTAALRETLADLVDLHGQHEHQALLVPQTQLALLDRFADLDSIQGQVTEFREAWQAAKDALADAERADRDRAARLDLLEFQRHEIDKVAPRAGEDAALEADRRVASNADRLSRLCNESYAALYDDDEAVLSRLGSVWKRVGELAELDPRFVPFEDAREAIRSQLEELAFTLRDFATSIEGAGDRLQTIEDRLALLERLKQRYGPTLDEVLARRKAVDADLAALEGSAERLTALRSALADARRAYHTAATRLSHARHEAASRFTTGLAARLSDLAMPGARCELRFDSAPDDESRWTATGFDRVELLFSPNPGEDLRPMARIASGGELSRVMLAIKTLASTDVPGKTLIFDEVDAGIGGRVATVVGERLRELAGRCQVLCITHLPQVAAGGHAHYLVSKGLVGDRTVTRVEPLAGARRVEEIARMMGGREVTAKVMAGAKDLIESFGDYLANQPGERRKAKAKVGAE